MIVSSEAVNYTYEHRLEFVARDSRANGHEEGLEQGRKESEAKIAELTALLDEVSIKH